jgi:hypothetical protein
VGNQTAALKTHAARWEIPRANMKHVLKIAPRHVLMIAARHVPEIATKPVLKIAPRHVRVTEKEKPSES